MKEKMLTLQARQQPEKQKKARIEAGITEPREEVL